MVIDELKFDEIKTKKFAEVMDNLKAVNALVVINENDKNVVLSARNLPDAKTILTGNMNVYDIMKAGTVVLTKDAVSTIEEVYA
jgi:large subunit ribosomal protein L4